MKLKFFSLFFFCFSVIFCFDRILACLCEWVGSFWVGEETMRWNEFICRNRNYPFLWIVFPSRIFVRISRGSVEWVGMTFKVPGKLDSLGSQLFVFGFQLNQPLIFWTRIWFVWFLYLFVFSAFLILSSWMQCENKTKQFQDTRRRMCVMIDSSLEEGKGEGRRQVPQETFAFFPYPFEVGNSPLFLSPRGTHSLQTNLEFPLAPKFIAKWDPFPAWCVSGQSWGFPKPNRRTTKGKNKKVLFHPKAAAVTTIQRRESLLDYKKNVYAEWKLTFACSSGSLWERDHYVKRGDRKRIKKKKKALRSIQKIPADLILE